MIQRVVSRALFAVSLASFVAYPIIVKADAVSSTECWRVFAQHEQTLRHRDLSQSYGSKAEAKRAASLMNGRNDGYNYGYEQCSAHAAR